MTRNLSLADRSRVMHSFSKGCDKLTGIWDKVTSECFRYQQDLCIKLLSGCAGNDFDFLFGKGDQTDFSSNSTSLQILQKLKFESFKNEPYYDDRGFSCGTGIVSTHYTSSLSLYPSREEKLNVCESLHSVFNREDKSKVIGHSLSSQQTETRTDLIIDAISAETDDVSSFIESVGHECKGVDWEDIKSVIENLHDSERIKLDHLWELDDAISCKVKSFLERSQPQSNKGSLHDFLPANKVSKDPKPSIYLLQNRLRILASELDVIQSQYAKTKSENSEISFTVQSLIKSMDTAKISSMVFMRTILERFSALDLSISRGTYFVEQLSQCLTDIEVS